MRTRNSKAEQRACEGEHPEPPQPVTIGGVDLFRPLFGTLDENPNDTIDYNEPPYERWTKTEVTII
jgi:hypothetical protein